MSLTLVSLLLVLGWAPMLFGVWFRKSRREGVRPEPSGARPSLEERIALADRVLLFFTWLLCAAQTTLALWYLSRGPALARLATGISLFFAGMALWTGARWALGAGYGQVAPPPPALVMRGPYAIVRHPLYLGTALACLGLVLVAGALVSFAVWMALVLTLALRARREERLLKIAFGPAWEGYARHTARALPFLY